jgi:hypothetical protein
MAGETQLPPSSPPAPPSLPLHPLLLGAALNCQGDKMDPTNSGDGVQQGAGDSEVLTLLLLPKMSAF